MDSSWLGPYSSGATVAAGHTWIDQGSYEIKVMAKDEDGLLSQWSDSLAVDISLICGDASNDGAVDLGDVVYLLNYLFRGGSAPVLQMCVGDVNSDDAVDLGDAVYILNWLFRGGPLPDPDCCDPVWGAE